jgi:uncharacterized protein YhaN
MTTDERIARLAERHEALTQSVELLLQTVQQQSQQMSVVADAMTSLVQIVRAHEARITELEEGG